MIIDYLVLRLLRDARNGIFNRFLDSFGLAQDRCARNDPSSLRYAAAGRGGKLDYEGDEQEEHADYDGGEGDF